ncbi:MAG: hypothetical protein QOI54_1826 [Actinomycetota bacterium]|jgi:hypothetical protein|nr:hypothetical protein [Actinomycetota bacterium]
MRRFVCVLGFCVLLALGVVSPSDAATATPAPYPSTGGSAAQWVCEDAEPSATPPPWPSTDCTVTEWAADPSAPTSGPPAPVDVTGAGLTDEQFRVLSFGVGLLVFMAAAHTVGSWRS